MKKTIARLALLLLIALGAFPPRIAAQREGPRLALRGIREGQLLTMGDKVHARAAEGVLGVEFWFTPEASPGQPILIGTDRQASEPTFGPDCGEMPCQTHDEFSAMLGRSLARLPEGWGRLSVREVGSREDAAWLRVYWDETPPRAEFLTPRFNASPNNSGFWQVITHTLDENILSIKVFWQLAFSGGRNIPRFEQHFLGGDFAGHAACVPTTVGANLKWLHITSQWITMKAFFNDDFIVNSLGFFMNTTTSGTSGADAVNGTVDYLNFWFDYHNGVDYNLEHLLTTDTATNFGFSPQQVLEQFQAGGAISLGFHNLPHIEGNLFDDPPFGHFLALDNVVLNQDGTAWIRVMDPHLQPPATMGTYRWFKLHPNGTLEWTAANPGYYNPFSGRVRLDELHIIRDYHFFSDLGADTSALSAQTSQFLEVPTRGEVSGRLTEGGHTWVGSFKPPDGSAGPWLLISESTDAAGQMQRAYRYIGGRFGTRPPE